MPKSVRPQGNWNTPQLVNHYCNKTYLNQAKCIRLRKPWKLHVSSLTKLKTETEVEKRQKKGSCGGGRRCHDFARASQRDKEACARPFKATAFRGANRRSGKGRFADYRAEGRWWWWRRVWGDCSPMRRLSSIAHSGDKAPNPPNPIFMQGGPFI